MAATLEHGTWVRAMSDPRDPFLAFRFDLRFNAESMGGFSECTGISLEFQLQEYGEGGRNGETLKFPTRGIQTNVILKRGIVNRRLWEWYSMLLRGEPNFRKTASIQILDPAGAAPAMSLELANAFPCKWIGPDLNASQSNIALESLEICHEGLSWINT